MAQQDPEMAAPVTTLSSLQIIPNEQEILAGNFFGVPRLTQAQINEIPTENLVQGIIVFNTDYDCYMGFVQGSIPDTPGRWCNFNASITYNGSGYEAGSPFALPLGPRSVVESTPNNMDPGVMYVDSENNDQPRIYIPSTGWQDIATADGGEPTFSTLNVTGNTILNTVTITGNTILNTVTITRMNGALASVPSFTLFPQAGTGATATMTGSELAGQFTLTTGTTGSTPGAYGIASFTLTTPMPYPPEQGSVIFTPANNNAASVNTTVYARMLGGTSFALLATVDQALSSSLIYQWNYMIMGSI